MPELSDPIQRDDGMRAEYTGMASAIFTTQDRDHSRVLLACRRHDPRAVPISRVCFGVGTPIRGRLTIHGLSLDRPYTTIVVCTAC
jgi:hypothetical protein